MRARWAGAPQRRRSSSSSSTMSWQLALNVPRSCSRQVSTMPIMLQPAHSRLCKQPCASLTERLLRKCCLLRVSPENTADLPC